MDLNEILSVDDLFWKMICLILVIGWVVAAVARAAKGKDQ